jgi:hypothetical protein
VFLSLIIATLIVVTDYCLPGAFLQHFLDSSFIETFGGLVGFNIAAVIFISGQLYVIEERSGKSKAFLSTKTEIKHNAYFLLSSFVLSIVILLMRPDLQTDTAILVNKLYYTLNIFVLAVFSLAFFAVFEILRAVFTIGDYGTIGK